MRQPATDETGKMADRKLVERYLDGLDEAAFRALYRRHTPVVYRFALRRLGAPDAAETVVQETWLRAARGLAGFRWESSLRSWLVGIALNCCRELGRERRRERPAERIPSAGNPSGRTDAKTEKPPRRGDLRVDLERVVSDLPGRAREVLILHDVEGYTHAEIGSILEIAPGTSKSQLSRARARLREALEDGERRSEQP